MIIQFTHNQHTRIHHNSINAIRISLFNITMPISLMNHSLNQPKGEPTYVSSEDCSSLHVVVSDDKNSFLVIKSLSSHYFLVWVRLGEKNMRNQVKCLFLVCILDVTHKRVWTLHGHVSCSTIMEFIRFSRDQINLNLI